MRSVLVTLDGSELSEQIIPLARRLAEALQTHLQLLSVVDAGDHPGVDHGRYSSQLHQVALRQESRMLHYLNEQAGKLSAHESTVVTNVVFGSPADEISNWVCGHEIEFVAMATHGRTGLARWALGSVTEKVLRTSKAPVLLLRPDEENAAYSIQSIVLPLDGSLEAEVAAPWAVKLARGLHLPIRLVGAVSLSKYAYALESDPTVAEELTDAMTDQMDSYLVAAAERLRDQGIAVNERRVIGDPVTAIIEEASAHQGLVVMRTHGRAGLSRAIVGSVTDGVIRHGTVPVLAIPPEA